MAIKPPDLPHNSERNFNAPAWTLYFKRLTVWAQNVGALSWLTINFTGSNITDVVTRRHRDLQDLQGGTTAQYYHLTQASYNWFSVNGLDMGGVDHIVGVNHLGVGTTVVPDILGRFVGDNGALSRVSMRGYSNNALSSSIRVAKYRGTYGSPSVVQSGDSLGKFQFGGYNGTDAASAVSCFIEAITTETWSVTANGSKIQFRTCANTTASPAVALTLNQDKTALFEAKVSMPSMATYGGNLLISDVAPTISSGFGTNPSIVSNNGTLTFRLDVGTGGTASSGVIGLPTAANGWNAIVQTFNPTATHLTHTTTVTASTNNSITLTNLKNSDGTAVAWVASTVLIISAQAY